MLAGAINQKLSRFIFKGVLAPRILGSIVAVIWVSFGVFLLLGSHDWAYSLAAALVSEVALYFGTKWSFSSFKKSKSSWSRGMLSGSILLLCFCLFLPNNELYTIGIVVGGFINVNYLFAKISCMFIGCCGIKSIKDKKLFGWPFRPRLQSLELSLTCLILILSALVFFINPKITVISLFLGHVLLRVFSARYRFPYKKSYKVFLEPAIGGLVAFSIYAALA